MEVVRIALGVGLPTMRSEVAKDQQELRRLLSEVSWEHLPEEMQSIMEVCWQLCLCGPHTTKREAFNDCCRAVLQQQDML